MPEIIRLSQKLTYPAPVRIWRNRSTIARFPNQDVLKGF